MSWKTLKAWIEIQKIPRHSNDIFSCVLGAVLAWYHVGVFHWGIFLCALVAVFFIANGIYLTNEAQDYEGDRLNMGRIGGRGGMGLTTTGGTQVLVRGYLKREHVQVVGMLFFALAIPLGLIIQFVFHAPPWTILLGVVGMFVTYSYSNPPIKASYRGLGETFMMAGYALLVFTAYYMQAGPSWFPLIVALPRIITVPALKIIREFPDRAADEASGKRTLVVILGQGRMARVYTALIVLALIAFIPTAVVTRSLFAVLNALPAVYLVRSIVPMVRGRWHNRIELEQACSAGFIGLLLTPVTLTATFLLDGLFSF
ncbi:MAG: prenyltransferase [Dehalococcoidia bacterium]|nr:prenyltransferase [Dehalococcoidia bacterium]